ncbi:hypothetical protein [Rhizobium rhizogenes]|uniref:hypothetical protein n=1 Tax=Rhizobium rhizogenes TaxID=359 RepID=UPI001574653E|nr:hypothetical protein [Rhizobium rhizogenes]NTH68658.1 hypothetical protein [Rhizobium rhizogenes]NTI39635.1 hypothetical protein [Rhizobium rhizogenes]WEO69857.1 hypothetical protein G6L54_032530 [Rhizobium rhizogenes]
MRYNTIPIFWHMKTLRSKFVIEYKTNRRQAKVRPTSIWGNLDLQAAARAVAADGVVPKVNVPQVPSVLEKVAAANSDVATTFAQIDIKDLPGRPSETLSLNDGGIEPVAIEGNAFNAGPLVQEERTSVPSRAPRSRAKLRTKGRSPGTTECAAVLGYRRDPSVQSGSEDELAAVEAENRRLKRLMIVKLREENDRLKSALRRFWSA